LYAANGDSVLAYVMRRTANGEDAADVFAEVFLTVWRRLDDVPPGGQARPWMFGVARRALANHHRGERRRTALVIRLGSELSGAQQAARYGSTGDSALAEALGSLPERYREVLLLADWEGLNAEEIAVVLGCSANAVRIRLHRARRRLARALESRPAAGRGAGGRRVSSPLAEKGDLG
jgi:RNA polymerase sigma factor (sigma-70 family)